MTVAEQRRQILAEGFSDANNRLISANDPLASLQRSCGGSLPGLIAIPELLALTRKAHKYGLRLTRQFQANDGLHRVSAWVELEPTAGESSGCYIRVLTWQVQALVDEGAAIAEIRRQHIGRSLAELTARLDPSQNIISSESTGGDLETFEQSLSDGLGQPWTRFVSFVDNLPAQPLHWRLLDGATCHIPGSERIWRVHLEPLGAAEIGGGGFNLYLVPTTPLATNDHELGEQEATDLTALTSTLLPALHGPITRIIDSANAITSKLAGPLAAEYSGYAADIAAAGRHLQLLIDDLAELERTEDGQLQLNLANVDLAEVARQAARLLEGEARQKRIAIAPPPSGERLHVKGDEQRVLQIVLNLLGNAIKYGPDASQVWLQIDYNDGRGTLMVADQGRGLSADEQARIFDKFERLGRTDAQGSGLGLYIAQRLASAMSGQISIDSAPGQGARFTLALPLAD